MAVTDLNHFFVRANDLEKTKDFYCDVLGFEMMPRPDFPFPGYWLGVNGKIQVHLGPHGIPNSDLYYLGTPVNPARDHAGGFAGGRGVGHFCVRDAGSRARRCRCWKW